MYDSVQTETLARWLEHAESLDLGEIAAEIAAEIEKRTVQRSTAD